MMFANMEAPLPIREIANSWRPRTGAFVGSSCGTSDSRRKRTTWNCAWISHAISCEIHASGWATSPSCAGFRQVKV